MPLPNPLTRLRLAGPWVAGGTALYCLVIIWLRTGLVPAESGGDEVWWSESAYNWIHEGVFKFTILDDDKGSAIRSFWPPVAPII